ncbi:uncharacterized protein LOC110098015 [Dendrobium catenatum]|uniref:uncharacterized protein LOC110098015 n=1 Tax=Dendrobium catenatum TaxID=906689 RepID=UPI0009F3200A|nr:uncharacterized protein LOC110098015 [Dendrobium catenatum]
MNSLLFWNCRGARKKEASLYLKEIVRDHGVCFVGLMETKLSSIDRTDVDFLIGKDWDYFHFPDVSTAGGIMVLWNSKSVSFTVERSDSQVVVGSLHTPSLGVWKVATVYSSRCNNERRILWSMLENSLMDSGHAIVVGWGGDFNCFVGPSFTWCNNKDGSSRIWERLDKCLLNSSALQLMPFGKVKHLARVASDHSPIVFNMDARKINRNKSFRFEDTWRSYPAAWSIVKNSWRKADFGDEEDILHTKLKRSLRALFF